MDSSVFDLRFSRRSVRKVTTYGTWQHIVLYNFTDVSEESTPSFWSKSKPRSQQVSFLADLLLVVRFEVSTAVTMMIIIFWEITPCGSYKNRRFGGLYRLHLQGARVRAGYRAKL
jgi:hypothetical protein